MPFVNPIFSSLCPFCFEKFRLADCDIVASRNDPNTGQPVLAEPKPSGWRRALAYLWVKRLDGPVYTDALACRRCPHCGELLPRDFEGGRNHIIAMVGGGASGKSHYIAALIDQLQRCDDLDRLGRESVRAADDNIKETYNLKYREPFIVRKEPLPLTTLPQQGARYKPLVYTIEFRRRRTLWRPLWPVHRINLVFFDGSGEGFYKQVTQVQFTRYVFNASAMIFLVDPLTVDGIVDNLPPPLHPTQKIGEDPVQILDDTAHLIKDIKRMGKPGAKLKMPLAVTISKADLLPHAVGIENQHLQVLRPADYTDGFRLPDMQKVSREIESLLLGRFAAGRLVQMAQNHFKRTIFCAVSAAGGQVDPKTKHFNDVRPHRCLDPLLWILAELGAIDSVKE